MKPQKTHLIFSILVITVLLTGSIIPLTAQDYVQEAAAAEGLAVLEGYMWGPFWIPLLFANFAYLHNLNNYIQAKSSITEGISYESYSQALFDDWKGFSDAYTDIFMVLSGTGSKLAKLYFVRVAEYSTLDYLWYESLPEENMKHVIEDMKPLINYVMERLDYLFDHLAADNEERLPEGYVFDISGSYPPAYAPNTVEAIKRDNIKFYYVLEEASTNETVIWDLENLVLVKMEGVTKLDATRYFTTAPGHFEIYWYDSFSGTWQPGRYVLLMGPQQTAAWNIIDYHSLDGLTNAVTSFYDFLRDAYLTARDYAKLYHEWLRSMGYKDRADVPDLMICPPPDIIPPVEVVEIGPEGVEYKTEPFLSYKDLAILYDAWWENAVEGLTPTGEIKSCVALVAEKVSEGNYTVTHTITYTTTYTTVVNATTTTTVINGTTTTTTVGGTTVTKTGLSTTTYVYRQGEAKIPDPFTRLYNVTICVPSDGGGENCFTVYEMAIVGSLCSVCFEKGKTTTLSCPLRAIVDYGDGYLRYLDLPSGTKITPQKIIAHNADGDVEIDRYCYEERPLPDWLDLHKYSHSPETVTIGGGDQTAAAIGMLWTTMLVILPMFIGLIAVLAIPKILTDILKVSEKEVIP